ncbi:MAG TPA: aspartate carbamoyltransferase catalytic subunit [Candidatus Eisenbacteria bacterium]|jgi:aspartate carbamoyltransferase catalytic subunit
MQATTAETLAPKGAGFFLPRNERHLLGLEGIPRAELLDLLEDSQRHRAMLDRPGAPTRELEGVTVCNAFFESSTRTRVSFELAEKRLSAISVSFASAESSTRKGETLLDTLQVIQAMKVDLVVVRHPSSGAAAFLARHLEAGVINAGDGQHEHPTQGLLDLLTLKQAWGGRFEGRRIAIVGDIAHSRVARSAIFGLGCLGTAVTVAGPASLMPREIERMGVSVASTVEQAMQGADAVMALRLQHERMEQGLLASLSEYSRAWGVDARRVRLMKPDAVVMHPGPINRGVELSPDVADGPHSVVLAQVTNGVAVRCAVLKHCAAARQELP